MNKGGRLIIKWRWNVTPRYRLTERGLVLTGYILSDCVVSFEHDESMPPILEIGINDDVRTTYIDPQD